MHTPIEARDTVEPLIVAIATTGRPRILRETLRHLAGLADRPDKVLLAIADEADFDANGLPPLPFPLEVLRSEKGLCVQRNAVLEAAGAQGIVVFLDDDFLPSEGFMTAARQLFAFSPEVVMATGHVLADGILGPGLAHSEALHLLDTASTDTHASGAAPSDTYNGYGCNMAVRMSAVAGTGLRFDPALPRYGWLEDVDFSRRLAAQGRIVRHPGMKGVHLGTKTGRSRGVPLGYSQIANPVYLMRKGTMSRRRALTTMIRNVVANTVKSVRPEAWVDRRGRLRGNLLAIRELLTGRLDPQRILDL